jgi:drug/metabolite transporter (DMT)-like permease
LGGSSAAADGNGQNQTVWCSVMMLSCVPMVLSSVYKESALRGEDIDVVYLNGWVAVFQFAIGLPLLWPSALASNLPLADLAPNLVDGFWCFMGKRRRARARSK